MARRAHAEQVDEDFTSIVFRFTGNYNHVFVQGLKEPAEQPKSAVLFSQWREQVRIRHMEAHGFTDSLFNGDEMNNMDSDLLSWLYNPVGEHSLFEAYIRGTKHKDLGFLARARGGAIGGLGSPEEVGLVNFDPEGLDDGIWYLSHKQSEFTAGTASSLEERRFVEAHKIKIETVIGGNDHLTSLVYLPISAYIDSTQRWELFGTINKRFTAFVDEVTPHEVAHQWWGHAVGWATYHDQRLWEGFAEFSAGLFLQQATGPKWQSDYIQFWERLKRRVLEKNQFGASPNDSGPLWLGLRLISPRWESAYQNVTYPKGAFMLAMLRSLMYTNKDHDKAFIEMMHDFVEIYSNKPASTEAFKDIAEKHISHAYDFENNGRLDWFFREWVYGTEVPRYHFEYQLTPAEGGKTKLHLTLTQSEVSDSFVMSFPIFADFGKGVFRLGQLPAIGNSTKSYDFEFPVAPKKVELNTYKEILER